MRKVLDALFTALLYLLTLTHSEKQTMKKYFATFLIAAFAALALAACNDADVASQNISRAADNFEVNRRVVFYNGITGDYMLSIEGYCSRGNSDTARQVTITCKTGAGQYKKHFLGLSDNVTYFIEQLEPAVVGVSHYVVVFKPSVIIPDVKLK